MKSKSTGRVNLKHNQVNWPLTLSDLTPLDYLFFDYVKSQVHKHKAQIIHELKGRIIPLFGDLDRGLDQHIIENVHLQSYKKQSLVSKIFFEIHANCSFS